MKTDVGGFEPLEPMNLLSLSPTTEWSRTPRTRIGSGSGTRIPPSESLSVSSLARPLFRTAARIARWAVLRKRFRGGIAVDDRAARWEARAHRVTQPPRIEARRDGAAGGASADNDGFVRACKGSPNPALHGLSGAQSVSIGSGSQGYRRRRRRNRRTRRA